MLITVLVFLAILSVLVLVHEFGHFVAAKFAGVGILEFALGLPFTKPLWSKKLKSGVKISLYPILFGGFVKLLGEEGEEKKTITGKYFYKAGVWQRIGVVVAGVTMNFLLAVAAFYLFLSLSGFKVLVPKVADYKFLSPAEDLVVITGVVAGSPAQKASLKFGDLIYSADGRRFSTVADFQKYTASRGGQKMVLRVFDENFSHESTIEVIPRKDPPKGQGPLGVGIGEGSVLNFRTWQQRLISGFVYTLDMLFYSIRALSGFVTQAFRTGDAGVVTENVSGPVGIAKLVGDILEVGGVEAVKGIVNLLGVLSVSLAFMNILPFPALDGGKLAFLLVEAFFGKKMAAKKENLINQAGMVFLLGLIILITFNDVKKVFFH